MDSIEDQIKRKIEQLKLQLTGSNPVLTSKHI